MRWFFLMAALLSAPSYFAQSSGIVRDVQSKELLVGCVVYDISGQNARVTDAYGRFEWPAVQTTLVFKALGYQMDTLNWTGTESGVYIELIADLMNEVHVVEQRQATELSLLNPQGFQTLGIKELCKAACCNLSESFETNASIDAAFTDAITGTKQIRMLGLDGKYTQIMFDNLPGVRGLASTYGLTYVPGPFIYQIQIAKGAGSVTAGYESIAGQINVAHKSPENAERLFLNGYVGSGGRTELNLVMNPLPSSNERKWSTSILAHGAYSQWRRDMNRDGFLDNPLFTNLIARNEWRWRGKRGWGGQYAASLMHLQNVSGQNEYNPLDELKAQLWGVQMKTRRYEVTGKTGYVFPDQDWTSFGSQVSVVHHRQNGNYGFRQYDGKQTSARINLLFASRIGSDQHKYVVGLTGLAESYAEKIYFTEFPPINLSSLHQDREELVLGGFAEYTWSPTEDWIIVAGARADRHNSYGTFFTPRLHARWSISKKASFKLMTGQGRRVPNAFMDNVGMVAGNRAIVNRWDRSLDLSQLDMEVAWNTGLIWSQKLQIAHRDASFSIDAYRTNFQQQVVVDFETPEKVRIYNLNGRSYSHSFQMETQYSPVRRLDIRMAYRWLEVKTDYISGLLDKPLLNKHRAFVNVAYETKTTNQGGKWSADVTGQWISSKRIPTSGEMHHDGEMTTAYSNDYVQIHAQLTRVFSAKMEVYAGVENLTNFMVHEPIISAEDPQSQSFDSSLIWGPVFGRMFYFGFRWRLI